MPYYRCPACGSTEPQRRGVFHYRRLRGMRRSLPSDAKLDALPEPEVALSRSMRAGWRPRRTRGAPWAACRSSRPPAKRLVSLVSELVTNSIRHAGLGAGDPIDLDVRTTNGQVRIAVHDGGPGFRAERRKRHAPFGRRIRPIDHRRAGRRLGCRARPQRLHSVVRGGRVTFRRWVRDAGRRGSAAYARRAHRRASARRSAPRQAPPPVSREGLRAIAAALHGDAPGRARHQPSPSPTRTAAAAAARSCGDSRTAAERPRARSRSSASGHKARYSRPCTRRGGAPDRTLAWTSRSCSARRRPDSPPAEQRSKRPPAGGRGRGCRTRAGPTR